MMEPKFSLKGKLWIWQGKGAWYFITIPKGVSAQIKAFDNGPRRGFGSVRVHAKIGGTSWKTSIFPEKKGTYVLPVKAEVRKKEKISDGDIVEVSLELQN